MENKQCTSRAPYNGHTMVIQWSAFLRPICDIARMRTDILVVNSFHAVLAFPRLC